MTTKLESRGTLNNKREFTDKLKKLGLPPGVKVGALLLHGLTGMPNEMRSIEKALKSIGCDVEVDADSFGGRESKSAWHRFYVTDHLV
jgi:hypothetical protein